MKRELRNVLFEKYPKLFQQKDRLEKEGSISCDDKWFDLIDNLCGNIQQRVERVNRGIRNRIKNSPPTLVPTRSEVFTCEVLQIKEKFGILRFYTTGGDDYIDGLITMAMSIVKPTDQGKK